MLRIVIAGPDEVLSLWLAAAIAPAQGLEVVGTALDGESALDVVRRTQPDVVAVDLDIVMPPEGGLTLVAAIRAAFPETLILVLAAEAGQETAQAALAVGATGVLAKDGSAQIPTDLRWSDPREVRDAHLQSRERHLPRAAHETSHAGRSRSAAMALVDTSRRRSCVNRTAVRALLVSGSDSWLAGDAGRATCRVGSARRGVGRGPGRRRLDEDSLAYGGPHDTARGPQGVATSRGGLPRGVAPLLRASRRLRAVRARQGCS